MADDKVGLKGFIHAEHIRNGEVIAVIDTPNLIVTSGKELVANLIAPSGTGAKIGWMALGTNSTAEAVTQTALSGEHMRVASADAVSGVTATFTGTFSFTNTQTIYEAGLFNADTDGSMLSRKVMGAVNVINGDTMTLTWTVTVS